jgi:hypothetical protein
MQAVYFLGSPEQQKVWDTTDLGKTAFATQLFKRSAYQGGQIAGGVNLKDNLRQNDASGTPLEFIYEAADCRMWFTGKMITDVTEVWKGVADRMFRGNSTTGCVQGSTGDPLSVSGGGQLRGGDGQLTMKSESTIAVAGQSTNGTGSTLQPFTGNALKTAVGGSGWGVVAGAMGLAALL